MSRLSPKQALPLFRRYRKQTKTVLRGKVVRQSLHNSHQSTFLWLLIGGTVGFSVIFYYLFFQTRLGHDVQMPYLARFLLAFFNPQGLLWTVVVVVAYAFQFTLTLMVLYGAWPIVRAVFFMAFHRQRPTRQWWQTISAECQLCSLVVLAYLLVTLCAFPWQGFTALRDLWPTATWERSHNILGLHLSLYFLVSWAVVALLLAWLIPKLLPNAGQTRLLERAKAAIFPPDDDFALYLGESTGTLIARNHPAGIKAKQRICLKGDDAVLNLMILGGIGEGKTAALMTSLLLQLLDQDCGGLIFDVKGNFKAIVHDLTRLTGRPLSVISATDAKLNLLAGLTPEVAGAMLGSIFAMTATSKMSNFWLEQATHLSQGVLGILSFLPAHYTLEGLRRYVYDEAFTENIDAQLTTLPLDERQRRHLDSYRNLLAMAERGNDKLQNDVKSTMASALSHLTHPDIVDNFCASESENTLSLESVTDGAIFLVDMPEATYGGSYRIIHTLIKLRWFRVMEARRATTALNQTRKVFFMCDEYQKLITASETTGCITDVNFWDKARDTKAIGIISAQGLTSFYAALNDHDQANAVLQNFRQKLCFKTEDVTTLKYLAEIGGQAEIDVITESESTTSTEIDGKTHTGKNKGRSLTTRMQTVVDSGVVRNLAPFQAVAFLNLYQHSMDDVVNCQPVYDA